MAPPIMVPDHPLSGMVSAIQSATPATPQPPPPTTHHQQPTNLTKLHTIITTELTTWTQYMTTLTATPTYEVITLSGANPTSKLAALRHILETLPSRHKTLTCAYNAAETENIDLSDQCATLLEQINDPKKELNLEDWYDYKLFKGKKVRQEVLELDREVRELEEGRLKELRDLEDMAAKLKELEKVGMVEGYQVQLLVETMDEVGISASPAALVGGGKAMEGES